MTTSIFDNGKYKKLETATLDSLQNQDFKLTKRQLSSTRTAGDNIEDAISENFPQIIKKTKIKCSEYKTDYGRRDMADLSFVSEGYNYIVDVKTHRTNDAKFSMPNLTSVKRLSDLYKESKNFFVLFFVSYEVVNNVMEFKNVSIYPIEHLSWDCLRLGALGIGQIQIKNSNKIDIIPNSRKDWMIKLCDKLIKDFYPKEKKKTDKRIKEFKDVRDFWKNKE